MTQADRDKLTFVGLCSGRRGLLFYGDQWTARVAHFSLLSRVSKNRRRPGARRPPPPRAQRPVPPLGLNAAAAPEALPERPQPPP
jgi:hypothetical protein